VWLEESTRQNTLDPKREHRAYWGRKADAKWEGNKVRRLNAKQAVACLSRQGQRVFRKEPLTIARRVWHKGAASNSQP
jgi:hypothetical protein